MILLPAPPFAQQVMLRLESREGRGPMLEHSTTPAVLQLLGAPAGPLVMAPNVLFKIEGGKGGTRNPLTPKQIASFPELIDEAAAVFSYQGDLRVLTRNVDSAQNPIFICVRANGRDGLRTVNVITTAFGKADAIAWATKEIGSLLFVGQKANPRLPLPGLIYHQTGAPLVEGSDQIVLGQADLDKFRADQRSKNFAAINTAANGS